MKDVVIIPTYNEHDTIGEIVGRIRSLYPLVEIWIVDDNSPDGTSSVVKGMMLDDPLLNVLVREKKNGLGDAYKDILSRLQFRNDIGRIVTMDADGSHNPIYIQELLSSLAGADVSIGSRYIKGGSIMGWGWLRNLISRGGNTYVRTIISSPVHDLTSGFVAFTTKALDKIHLTDISSSGYSYQMEFKNKLLQAGCSFVEIPIIFEDRRVGKSKMSGKIIAEGIVTPWRILCGKKK
jgi:dolichol-phosphate mannosyltransferase